MSIAQEAIILADQSILPHLERMEMFVGGIGAFALGASMAVLSRRRWNAAGEVELNSQLYPDPDQNQTVVDQYRKYGRRSTLIWGGLGVATGLSGMQLAHPYTDTKSYRADEIAIVIEAGADSRAKDVDDSSNPGKESSRIQASLLSSLELVEELDGQVKVNIVLAGAHPESMGTASANEEAQKIFDNAAEYLQVFDNAGEPDIRAGIAIAEASNPDEIIVFVEDEGVDTADTIRDMGEKITPVSVGKPGTDYDFLGQTKTADYTNTFNGVDAKTAKTTDEIKAILKSEITDKIVQKGKEPIHFFGKLAVVLFGVTASTSLLREIKFPRKRRKA